MIDLRFDMSAFEQAARDLEAAADQIPFALSRALNDGADQTREHLIAETWPRGVKVRNQNFIRAALTTAGQRATKSNLSVTIYDKLGRASLSLHDTGGVKQGRGRLAIPGPNIRLGARGVAAGSRPLALKNTFVTDGRRANPHLKQGALYQRQGAYRAAGTVISRTGKKRKTAADFRTLKLMYVLRPAVTIKPTVHFHADFERLMPEAVRKAFPIRLQEAMRSRFWVLRGSP